MSAAIKLSIELQRISALLHEALNDAAGEDVGFVLLVSTNNGEQTEVNYSSNLARQDSMLLLGKMLTTHELGMSDVPLHMKH